MGPQLLLRTVLLATSLIVMGIGGTLLYSGSDVGWFLIGFGVIDLVTMPFTLRMIDRSSAAKGGGPAEPIDPTANPSYNPYARED